MRINEQYILTHFDEAVKQGLIKAYYQPFYRTLTGKICGAEALARWEDPEKGLISPAEFIPVLENHGLIYCLDMAILSYTCDTYRELKQLGDPVPPISINLSRLDFQEPDLFETVNGILEEHDVPVDAIDIEITESVMLEDTAYFSTVFNRFHDAGYHIWIDDFGSGYSSLNVIQNYDFDTLKIDMLFLHDFNFRSRQMLSAIVGTTKRMGVHTLIEGVETEEQFQFMKQIGCEIAQGYHLSRPLRREAFVEKIDSSRSSVENREEYAYYSRAGFFNVLGTNPLEEFGMFTRSGNHVEHSSYQSEIPIALVEYDYKKVTAEFLYINGAYDTYQQKFGYPSYKETMQSYNDRVNPRFLLFKKFFDDALVRDGVQNMDYLSGRLHSSIKVRCISKMKDKAIMALSLRTFQSVNEEIRMEEFDQYSRSLFMTYDHVVVFFPDEDKAERIYSIHNFGRDYDVEPLHKAAHTFCNTAIYPADRERYAQFIDTETLVSRVNGAEGKFIEQMFRIVDREKEYIWRSIRLTKMINTDGNVLLFTIQKVSPESVQLIEKNLQ